MGEAISVSGVESVRRLLEFARAAGASDLHLDPVEAGLAVRARINGVLEESETLSPEFGPATIGRLKAMADLLAYRTDVPQEGRIPASRSGIDMEVRVATYPTLLGERAALRFDAPGGLAHGLDALGLPAAALRGLEHALAQPEGVILLTGPSGSGKTTTLYAALAHIREQAIPRSMVSVEDPVERRIRGVTQTEVNPASGLDFATALRSLLRQDPDVILVGEIRDRETAAIALEAGLTGHLVAATIHAGTASQVFTRLLEMGVEPFVATTAVRGVLAQRLVRRLAPDGEGYDGRVLIAEWLEMGPELRRAVLDRSDGSALADATGHTTLRTCAEKLVSDGVTTPEEIDRVLGDD